MKNHTPLAIISISILLFIRLTIPIDQDAYDWLFRIFEILSYICLLPFFIKLYKKQ